MKVGVYLCQCGTSVSEKIDPQRLAALLLPPGSGVELYFRAPEFVCAADGQDAMVRDLQESRPDRVLVAACSPLDLQATFMKILARGGLNPYLLHMVNVREQIAWVTSDAREATDKALRALRGGLRRLLLQEALASREIDVSLDVVVIGAGPAGLKAALTLAEAGRRVVLVEKGPAVGGLGVRLEETFPSMECGACVFEPLLRDVLRGDLAERIELLTLAEVSSLAGSFGNFFVQIRQRPRYVNTATCIACGQCLAPCPASRPDEFFQGLRQRRAIAVPYLGALPNAPFLDDGACLRGQGQDCQLCLDACPVPGAIRLDDVPRTLERRAGAILVATGAGELDVRRLPQLGYGRPGVVTASEFEALVTSSGPTEGAIRLPGGRPPRDVAIVHCVGSLDRRHEEYCSGICCQYALKFDLMIGKRLPGARVHHLYKELALAGKDASALYHRVTESGRASFLRYRSLDDLLVEQVDGGLLVHLADGPERALQLAVDLVVLCPAIVPKDDAPALAERLGLPVDAWGFFQELHGATDAAQSRTRGVYLAGACQGPMDIARATALGVAAAGHALAALVAGRKLEISPVHAVVDDERCSGCRVCGAICPYKAIRIDGATGKARVEDVLCVGCGTCVAACPAGAMANNHFTQAEILAEIEGLLV